MNKLWKALGAATGAYAGYTALAWLRYGRPRPPRAGEEDALLDRFLPVYDVVERHQARLQAPADAVLEAAKSLDFDDSTLIRAVFKGREILMGSSALRRDLPPGMVDKTKALGWGVLAEVPGREIVLGAITQPWEADVKFHPLPPDEFASFNEPDFVKIVWTLRADPSGPAESIFRTETRVAACGARARALFRNYWALLSPGIILIRMAMLRLLSSHLISKMASTSTAAPVGSEANPSALRA